MRKLNFMGAGGGSNKSSTKKNWTLWTQTVLTAAASGAVTIALLSYDPSDPSLTTVNRRWTAPHNQLGYLGSWAADFLYQCFGWAAWVIPLFGLALIILNHTGSLK